MAFFSSSCISLFCVSLIRAFILFRVHWNNPRWSHLKILNLIFKYFSPPNRVTFIGSGMWTYILGSYHSTQYRNSNSVLILPLIRYMVVRKFHYFSMPQFSHLNIWKIPHAKKNKKTKKTHTRLTGHAQKEKKTGFPLRSMRAFWKNCKRQINERKTYWINETRTNRLKRDQCDTKILMYMQNVSLILKIMVVKENKWLHNRNLVT